MMRHKGQSLQGLRSSRWSSPTASRPTAARGKSPGLFEQAIRDPFMNALHRTLLERAPRAKSERLRLDLEWEQLAAAKGLLPVILTDYRDGFAVTARWDPEGGDAAEGTDDGRHRDEVSGWETRLLDAILARNRHPLKT